MIEVWGLESHAVEWRRQRSRWMFKGYPRRKKAEGGTRRVQGGVFHRHGGQGLTQVLRETQSLCLVCLEVCPVWVGKV